MRPSLNRFDPASGTNTAWPMPQSIGSFALRERGGFVVALRDGIWFVDRGGALERKVADAPYDPATHRFNDGRADPQGRFWVGSMNEKRDANSARLYRLGTDLSLTPMLDDMMISNGLGFSPDGRTMYHSDTPPQTVRAYDFDGAERDAVQRSRLRTFRRRRRAARRRGGRQRRMLLERVLPRRQAGQTLAAGKAPVRVPGARHVSDHVRVRRRGSAHALRDDRAPDARGARACAASPDGRTVLDEGRRRRLARAEVRGLTPGSATGDARGTSMKLDSTAFIRLDAPNSLGATASGASFATNTGDILEVACFGTGLFRLRVGPNTEPDYGLILSRAQRCDVAQPAPGAWTFSSGDARLEIRGEPLSIQLFHDGQSCPDVDHRRALPRLHAHAGDRPRAIGPAMDRLVRARLRRPGVRARREIRTAQQARPVDRIASRGRARRQHRALVQERSVLLGSGRGKIGVGNIHRHAGPRDARRGAPRLVAPVLLRGRRRRSARPVPPVRPRPRRSARTLHASHGTRSRRAPVGPRPVGVESLLSDARGGHRRRRASFARAAFPATC